MLRLIFTLLLSAVFVFGSAKSFGAGPPSDETSQIINRLDAIMKRLDDIERRLAKLEETTRSLTQWWVDDHGVMRSFDGRPVGHWGIDGPSLEPRR